MKILAFDSGIERTGYAFFSLHEKKYTLEKYGCLFTSKKDLLEKRIVELTQEIEKMIKDDMPNYFVFEQLFFNFNKKTAIMVAQAQGSLLYLAGLHNIPVYFITPLQIKHTVTGYGGADKKSVQKMIKILLGLKETPQPDDTADAIACGLTFCTLHESLVNSAQVLR